MRSVSKQKKRSHKSLDMRSLHNRKENNKMGAENNAPGITNDENIVREAAERVQAL